ncbi:MAG: DUF1444 family protein [Acidobacteriota bacterium]
MTPEQYQQHVLGLLATTFPDEEFEGSPDPFLIKHGAAELGLRNLYALHTEKQFEPEERDAHIREHVWRILEALHLTQDSSPPDWIDARDKLRLQLMRTEHTLRAPVITFPFTREVVVAIAIDLTHAYSYVSPANLERWKVTEELAYEQALSNLEQASAGIQIHATEAPQRLLAIQTGDGYDAARLLLPAMRKLAVEHLGEPCYAAVPNRDFLIMWSRSNPEEFQTLVRAQVRHDCESQPYPLTSTVFVVTEADVKPDVA